MEFFIFVYFLLFIVSLFMIYRSNNMIFVLISMIFIFMLTGFLYIMVGIEYLGFLIFIIYVGAISILFLFVIMLLDLRTYSNLKVSLNLIVVGVMVLIFLSYCFFVLVVMDLSSDILNSDFSQFIWDFDIFNKINIKLFAEALYNNYYLQVLIVCFYFFIVIIIVYV